MSLAAGTRLGPYEVLAPIGVGGKGEVYRARDTRLGRDVAVKVISPRIRALPGRWLTNPFITPDGRIMVDNIMDHPSTLYVLDGLK